MAKPKVFVSSTYYDLKHIRASIEAFITSLGYEPVLFESGDIPFHHEQPLDLSCYQAVESAHIFVLIIGGRYGSPSSNSNAKLTDKNVTDDKTWNFYNSITVEEYRKAVLQDIPIYIFLEKGVAAEYQTYRGNRELSSIKYAHVDDVNIFKLIENIYAANRNNLIREFDQVEHITSWLKSQWAGLFADTLAKRKTESTLRELSAQVQGLNQVVESLRTYSEAIVRVVEPDSSKSEELIRQVEEKLGQDIVEQNLFVNYVKSHIQPGEGETFGAAELMGAVIDSSDLYEFLNSFNIEPRALEVITEDLDNSNREFELVRRSLYAIKALNSRFETPPVREFVPKGRRPRVTIIPRTSMKTN